MVEFVDAAGVAEIQNGQMKTVKMEGREILLAKVGDRFFAADNKCPHMSGNLAMGELNGTIVTCPLHHSQFDLTDGHALRWTGWTGIKLSLATMVKSPRPLKTYTVKIKGDRVLVEDKKAPVGVSQ